MTNQVCFLATLQKANEDESNISENKTYAHMDTHKQNVLWEREARWQMTDMVWDVQIVVFFDWDK